MALINCSECHAQISSNAASCPQCGNPNSSMPVEKTSTSTTAVQMNVKTAASGVAGLIAIGGLLTIFFLPPIGLLMFIVSGAISMFGNKKVSGLQGAFPNCSKLISLPSDIHAANCPICKGRFINEQNRFSQI